MCHSHSGMHQYSSETLRKIGVNWTISPICVVGKALFSTRIWSRRCEHPVHAATVRGDIITTIKSTVKPEVKLEVMNVWSVRIKLDYVFDHIFDNDLDIVAITETWLSNEDNNNTHVITECSNHGYTLHHVPMNSGSTGGGVGVLINDRVKLVTRLETVNSAVSFESMEMIITIVSISIRLVVIYRMPPSKNNKLKRGTFVTELS